MALATPSHASADSLPGVVVKLRAAQSRWADVTVRQRLKYVRRFRAILAERAEEVAKTVTRAPAETLVGEILPLAEGCRFLERNAEELLLPRDVRNSAPLWLRNVDLVIRREPCGVVLIIAPSNYPLFLPGVQLMQALAAGNAVLLKPGLASLPAAAMLVGLAVEAGFPADVITLLDESVETARAAIRSGVDKVLVTGSKETGQAVLAQTAEAIIPVIAELSGRDPVFVLEDADLKRTAGALRFGVRFNSGNTCIRPRTVYGEASTLNGLREHLGPIAADLEFVPVSSPSEAVQRASECEFALGASVFGNAHDARELASRIRAGVVVINDVVVPTVHPAVPFGGRGSSGFGVTRGAEGLLELTVLKTVAIQRSRWLPQAMPLKQGDDRLFSAFIRMCHARSLRQRLRACTEIWRAARNRGMDI